MTSQEKVEQLVQRLRSLTPPDGAAAYLQALLVGLLPAAMPLLPEDPAELDGFLKIIGLAALDCRSDDAPPLAVYEFEDEQWHMVGEEEEEEEE